MFDALTFTELAALSARFRSGREACRKVMNANWWNRPVVDTYRRMVVDFQHDDPLFASEWRGTELSVPMAE